MNSQYTLISCPCCGGKTTLAVPKGAIPDAANYFCIGCWEGTSKKKTQETQMFKAIKSWLKDLWSETYIIAEPTYEPRVPLHCEPMPEPTLEMTPDKTE
ncbi:MAG: hypothetical protein ABSA33_03970 [Candidatus Micrarchaeaceae archaeon]